MKHISNKCLIQQKRRHWTCRICGEEVQCMQFGTTDSKNDRGGIYMYSVRQEIYTLRSITYHVFKLLRKSRFKFSVYFFLLGLRLFLEVFWVHYSTLLKQNRIQLGLDEGLLQGPGVLLDIGFFFVVHCVGFN